LSELATVTLYLSTHESLVHNIGNFSLYPSVLFLLDVLYANVFSRNYEKHLADKIKYTKEYEKRRKSYNPLLSGGEKNKDSN
jgi:DNA-binding MurR/RpiR family transcriptional regulator